MDNNKSKLTHKIFEIGIFLKGLNGFLEMVGGFLLLTLSYQTINRFAGFLTRDELTEDPKDIIANLLFRSAHNLSASGQYFGALFLLSHGLIKILLIIALFKKKLWAYPLAVAVFGLFVIFETRRYLILHSPWLLVVSILDFAILCLTLVEYRNLKRE